MTGQWRPRHTHPAASEGGARDPYSQSRTRAPAVTFFPVPDEFFSDPQYLGWTAEAYALWTIAGSWSCARLTDGRIPTSAFALFPANVVVAAEELVERRIWKRARGGGYQYVTWPKQCTKAYVLAQREKQRLKKQRQREVDN